jgi:uncharacterized membrane protein YhaH (DUF805 family)
MDDLSPIGWALRPLKNYAKFSGRSSRAEFWWFFLFMMLAYMAIWVVMLTTIGLGTAGGARSTMGMISAFGVVGILLVLAYLALLIPSIAVQIRRLHDTNRSGWWLGVFWLLYIVYAVATFGTAFSATPGSTSPSLAGVGVMMVFGLLFFAYSIALLVFFCLPGTRGPNRFGDDPYGANVEEVFA